MYKVSVVVPIYGVAKYIERCARSLFEQTLENIEFIFVDDCTKDNSIAILERVIEDYPWRKSQITIMHHDVNKGLPQARKTGISVAHGEFIAHCDSDDWVDSNIYQAMYEKAEKENADVVICDYMVHNGINPIKKVVGCHNKDVVGFLENLFLQIDHWPVWNKLIRRTVYQNKIKYPTSNMAEDMVLVLQLLLYCKRIAYVPIPLYYYYYNNQSLTRLLTTEKILQNFNAVKENTDIVISIFSKIPKWKKRSCFLYLQYNVKAHLFPVVHKKKYRQIFFTTYPGLFRSMFFASDIPWLYKIKYIVSLLGLYPNKVNE